MTEEEIQVKALELTALSLAVLPEQKKLELVNVHADVGTKPFDAIQLFIMHNTAQFEMKLRHIYDLKDIP